MADIERAKKALINAHNSGDTEAATKLATYIKSQQESRPENAESGFAGGPGKAFGQAISGGAIPFGNVITSGLAAVALSPFTDLTAKELYEQAQADTRATQEANPGATLAGNIAGIAATLPMASAKALSGTASTQGIRGAINAIPEGLSAIGNFVRGGKATKDAGLISKTGRIALRSAKGAAVAAPTAGIYAAGESDPGERIEGFKSGARLGAAVGATLPVAGAVLGAAGAGTGKVYRGFKARDVEELQAAGQAIKDRSSLAYKAMRDSGATFKPGATNLIIAQMQKKLKEDGILNPRLHKKTLDLFEDFKNEALDQNITLEGLDQWRQLFGQVSGEFTDKVNARKASILKGALDDAMNELPETAFSAGGPESLNALRMARQEWARQSKFNAITDIVEASSGDANKLKRDLEKFRLNPKKTRGWSDEELESLKLAANQSTGEGVLKLVGKFGFDLGSGRSVGNSALPVLGSLVSGLGTGSFGPAMVVPAVGTAARVGQKMMARASADDLLKVIESGGQLTTEMMKDLPKSEQKKLLSRVMQMAPARSGLMSGEKVKP